jgi:hypothetical protein
VSAGSYNLRVEQYATFNLNILWTDSSGNPVNLTGYSADLRVVDSDGVTDLLTLSTTNPPGGITLGGILGTIVLNIPDSITALLPINSFKYDLLLTGGSGSKIRLLQGSMDVSAGITPT